MKPCILVFDDIVEKRNEVVAELSSTGGKHFKIIGFTPNADKDSLIKIPHEDGIIDEINQFKKKHEIALIVADRDLTGMKPYVGLNEPIVRRASLSLGIPECGYARGNQSGTVVERYLDEGLSRESCIRIGLDNNLGRKVIGIANGFHEIREFIKNNYKHGGPAKLLAKLLGKPEIEGKVELFIAGDRNRLLEISLVKASKNKDEKFRRLACFIGYWLWDSILRFPGIVVDEIAASSHLNIYLDDFAKNDKVKKLFDKALYKGPFSDALETLWWRDEIDKIVLQSECRDGLEFCTKKGKIKNLKQSQCCDDHRIPAGYLCVLTNRPVSLKNSVGGFSWYPRGADLARICKSENDKVGPWLNS